MGKTSRRELNAHKYKKYVGNKSEGTLYYIAFSWDFICIITFM